MIYKIAAALKKVLPHFLYNWFALIYKAFQFLISPFKKFFFKIKLRKIQNNQRKALELVKGKKKIKVAFFLIHESVWKYEGLYKLMNQDERFEPIVIVCPYIVYGEENMLRDMNQAYEGFKTKDYNVKKTLDDKTREWLDVKKEIKPDIVFFTNPWGLTKPEYLINNFLDSLTCYVPYFYHVTKHLKENYGGITQNFAWRVFYETETHFEYAKKYSNNNAKNVVITGYPGIDNLIFNKKSSKEKDPWKIKNRRCKRIIWAPHHTIDGQDAGLGFSNFKEYADFFINLLNKYQGTLQIAFKPHPLLKVKLQKDTEWGINKANKYYELWDELDNGFLVEGEYSDLFLNSDAIIHDSGSFTVEYLSTRKPALYLLNSEAQLNSLNSFGRKAVDFHYKASNIIEIDEFIEKVVFEGSDPLKSARTTYVNNVLLPPNNTTASQNIYDYIITQLK